jgi:hypothetical protein
MVRSSASGKAKRNPAGSLRDCAWKLSDLDEIICDMTHTPSKRTLLSRFFPCAKFYLIPVTRIGSSLSAATTLKSRGFRDVRPAERRIAVDGDSIERKKANKKGARLRAPFVTV